jgi:spermidine synthase
VAVPTVVFVLVVVSLPRDIYKRVFQKAQETFDLVYYREDHTATVTVHERGDRVLINLNGLNVAGTHFGFLTTQKMQAHLGLLLHPNPKRVLQIGFGSGGTCYSVSQHPGVERIDCVELCQGVIDAAKYFLPSNHQVLKNPIVHLKIEDARNYVLATPNRYDLILSDSIHPSYAGNGTLYSRDYFLLCKERLNPGGYVSFWLPTYLLSTQDYKTIVKTFQSVFPNVTIWYVNSAIEAYTIVVGQVEHSGIDVQRLRERLREPTVAKDLAEVEVYDERDVLNYFMMKPARVREFVAGGDINSDDYPIIELRAPKSMTRRGTWYRNLKGLLEMREPPVQLLQNVAKTTEEKEAFMVDLMKLYEATNYLIQGQLVDIISYDFAEEYRLYKKADELYAGNRTVQRLMASARSKVFTLEGEGLLWQSNFDEAVARYEQAVAVNPDPFDDTVGHAHFRLGMIYLNQRKPEKAGAELEKCLAVLPTHKQALLASATLALRASRFGEARRKIDYLLDLYPGDAEVKKLQRELRG